MLSKFLPDVLTALAPIGVALIAWISAHLAGFISQKTKNETLAGILTRLDDAVFSAVREVMMSTVDAAKGAASGGKLPAEIAVAAKSAALDKAKSYLGAQGVETLMKVLGIGDLAGVDSYISGKIESAVHQVKAAK